MVLAMTQDSQRNDKTALRVVFGKAIMDNHLLLIIEMFGMKLAADHMTCGFFEFIGT